MNSKLDLGEEVLQTSVERGAGRGLHLPLEPAQSSQSLLMNEREKGKEKFVNYPLRNVLHLITVHGQRQ